MDGARKVRDTKPLSFDDVLAGELEVVDQRREDEKPTPATDPARDALNRDLVGLSFSGGGIRSATFCLGVLQGIARFKPAAPDRDEEGRGGLRMYDYLSTVSGGGYVGSWFSAWVRRRDPDYGNASPKRSESKGSESKVAAPEQQTAASGIVQVERLLQDDEKSPEGDDSLRREPHEINWLRRYSNYLSPRLGLLSADTWTLLAIYLRNLILTQAVLLPMLFALVLLPRIFLSLLALEPADTWPWAVYVASAALVILLGWSFAGIVKAIVAIEEQSDTKWPKLAPRRKSGQGHMNMLMIRLSLCGLLVCWLFRSPDAFPWLELNTTTRVAFFAAFGVLHVIPYLAFGYLVVHRHMKQRTGETSEGLQARKRGKRKRYLWWAFAALLSGGTGGLLVHFLIRQFLWGWAAGHPHRVAAMGPALSFLVFLTAVIVEVGLLMRRSSAQTREWWATLGSWMLIWGLCWTVVSLLSLYAYPMLVLAGTLWGSAAFLGWVGSVIAGAMAGQRQKVDAPPSGLKKAAFSLVAPAAVLGFIVLVSLGAYRIVDGPFPTARKRAVDPEQDLVFSGQLQVTDRRDGGIGQAASGPVGVALTATSTPDTEAAEDVWARKTIRRYHRQLKNTREGRPIQLAAWALAGALLTLICSRFVDVNLVSIHNLYANRLVRCYLGASNPNRRPHPVTGFDPDDEMRLHDLKATSGPLHVVNTAINLVGGRDLAWQERKANAFSMTPLHCGYRLSRESTDPKHNISEEQDDDKPANLDAPLASDTDAGKADSSNESALNADDERKAYRPLPAYAGNVRLGTAVAISGAAASPSMGYHTAPALAFLMTILNVRLGWWLANTRAIKTSWWSKLVPEWICQKEKHVWTTGSPRFGIRYILSELVSQTDDTKPYVYLSDGGHFENLGVYELVRRRCRFIVACDAEADGDYQFHALAGVIRKCRIDFRVKIDIDVTPILPRPKSKAPGPLGPRYSPQPFALGLITYQEEKAPGEGQQGPSEPEYGLLIYIKSSLPEIASADIKQYALTHGAFPHQPTLDQFFDESQFESYRQLGETNAQLTLEALCTEELFGPRKKKARKSGSPDAGDDRQNDPTADPAAAHSSVKGSYAEYTRHRHIQIAKLVSEFLDLRKEAAEKLPESPSDSVPSELEDRAAADLELSGRERMSDETVGTIEEMHEIRRADGIAWAGVIDSHGKKATFDAESLAPGVRWADLFAAWKKNNNSLEVFYVDVGPGVGGTRIADRVRRA